MLFSTKLQNESTEHVS